MRTPLLTLAALSACALSTGCATAVVGAAASVGMFALQDRTIGEGIDDATASQEVKARLMATDRAGFAEVDVEVAQGSVLLSGVAPTDQHRQAAELVARNVRSVHTVYNEIFVGPRSGFVRSRQDDMITAQVRTRLVASRNVRGINVNIETFGGNVYLMGLVRSDQELQRAAEIASTTPGVRRVVSFMQIEQQRTANFAAAPQIQLAPQPSAPYAGAPMMLEPQRTAASGY
jgi:osmotically-inducible protein OsmY